MNTFLAQAQNNQWSNRRLLRACLALGHDEYVATRTSFFPSIEKTLLHILQVDRFYLAVLTGNLDAQREDLAAGLSLHQTAQLQLTVDAHLVEFCARLEEHALSRQAQVLRPQGIVLERVDRLLLHLFQHQIHHRGQVHAMLAGTRVAPPQLDEFYLDGDLPLRAQDEDLFDLPPTDDSVPAKP